MPRTVTRQARLKKRAEAEARNAARAERTIEEQLALLDSRRGNSARERARLEGALRDQEHGLEPINEEDLDAAVKKVTKKERAEDKIRANKAKKKNP